MKKKVLFIYREGTLVEEIPINYALYKIYPGAISYIGRIATEFYYEFVVVTNKIGLGTEDFPLVLFIRANEYFLRAFEGEGIHLSSIYIAHDKKNNLSGIEMLSSYFSKTYDRSQSFIRGNSIILLQKISGIQYKEQLNEGVSWKKIYNVIKFYLSECSYRRRSKETDIQIYIKKDGKGVSYIQTGFGFFDHLIDQICIHANLDLVLKIKGDLHVDEHHIMEDTAITLGVALSKTLKDKRGIARYGFLLPMDDVLTQVILDIGGRSNLTWKAHFEREKIGDVPTEMFTHFFKSFSDVAYCNLYIKATGNNEHHKIEAIFKAFACVLKMAIRRNYNNDRLPSTKEIL